MFSFENYINNQNDELNLQKYISQYNNEKYDINIYDNIRLITNKQDELE